MISTFQGWGFQRKIEQLLIKIPQRSFILRKLPTIELLVIHPPLVMGHTEIVKNGGSGGGSKTSVFSGRFSYFLSKINHRRGKTHRGGNYHGRLALLCRSGKFRTRYPLLVMVFQEIQHGRRNVLNLLYTIRKMVS